MKSSRSAVRFIDNSAFKFILRSHIYHHKILRLLCLFQTNNELHQNPMDQDPLFSRSPAGCLVWARVWSIAFSPDQNRRTDLGNTPEFVLTVPKCWGAKTVLLSYMEMFEKMDGRENMFSCGWCYWLNLNRFDWLDLDDKLCYRPTRDYKKK